MIIFRQTKKENMRKIILSILLSCLYSLVIAQSPQVTAYLQNTTNTGSYYVQGNSTAIPTTDLVNCQKVEYSTNWVYITTEGIPAYPTGPFLDGNPSQAQAQNAIYKMPLSPAPNTGNPTPTTPGNIGIFVNGVSLFDYRDGVAWNNSTQALCGGPGNPPCPGGPQATQDWNRDAIPAEMAGFDCSKAHPAMGNYHHHQNPSAFKLDLNVVSTICNMYDADGLYAIDSTQHSPLIGFAYDGYPIYGAYGYKNTDGTGGIVRMKSSYNLRNLTNRTNGPTVGQTVGNQTMFLGYFREDYEYVANSSSDYLDEHNGRFCETPEYPNGTYCYFATVDDNWNSAYPYVVGPTFYGNVTGGKVTSISEPTTIYSAPNSISELEFNNTSITIFPNPASDLIAIQINDLVKDNFKVQLIDLAGKIVSETNIKKGQTIAYFDTEAIYSGIYVIKISNGLLSRSEKIVLKKD